MFEEHEDLSDYLPAGASEKLSDKQQLILAVIGKFQQTKGYSPSMREIGELVGLKSVASVSYQLGELRAQGFLEKNEGLQRAIAPVASKSGVTSIDGNAKSIPLVGSIAAGTGVLAEQNVEDHFTLPNQLVGKSDDLFILKVRGESMIDAAICDGDWVVVRMQQTAENGDIVAALLPDGDATVKVFKQTNGHTWLLPRNSTFDPIDGTHAVIMGRVVSVLRSL
ncbi:MAG: transcriptional repressor LexA [Actinomycetota bacterium]|jgi:repressor LexA